MAGIDDETRMKLMSILDKMKKTLDDQKLPKTLRNQWTNLHEELVSIRQTTSVTEYWNRFEQISVHLKGTSEHWLAGVFENGLQDEIREEMVLFDFNFEHVSQAVRWALIIEKKNNAFKRVIPTPNTNPVATLPKIGSIDTIPKPNPIRVVAKSSLEELITNPSLEESITIPSLKEPITFSSLEEVIIEMKPVELIAKPSHEETIVKPSFEDTIAKSSPNPLTKAVDETLYFGCDEKFERSQGLKNKFLPIMDVEDEDQVTKLEEIDSTDEQVAEMGLRGLEKAEDNQLNLSINSILGISFISRLTP